MPGARDAEESLLAHIEFDRPELPWLFSPLPVAPNDQLPPWIALVVCDAAVSSSCRARPVFHRSSTHFLANCSRSTIPGLGARADHRTNRRSTKHSRPALGAVRTRESFAAALPAQAHPRAQLHRVSRPGLRLRSEGRQRARGGSLGPAWKRGPNDAGNQIVLPVFDSWSFSVAPAGDFELLAGRLQGLPAPWNVGRRFVDTSHPRGGLPKLPAGAPGEVQVLRCALVSPTPVPPDFPQKNSAWDAPTREKLRHEIDRVNANNDESCRASGPASMPASNAPKTASVRSSANRLTTLPRLMPTGSRSSTLHLCIAS